MSVCEFINNIDWPIWLTAFGTIALAIVAIFQDIIRAWIKRPILNIEIKVKPPDCHKTYLFKPFPGTGEGRVSDYYADCYYFRLRIINSGNCRAENVEVFASELTKKLADGTFERVNSFLPMNLLWAHIGTPFFNISHGMEKHCDLAHIVDPRKRHLFNGEENPLSNIGLKTFLSLDTIVKPNTMSHLIEPGIYRMKLIVGSSNTNPKERVFEINHTGEWIEDENRMLQDGIAVKSIT
jgi:hypothetical protein